MAIRYSIIISHNHKSQYMTNKTSQLILSKKQHAQQHAPTLASLQDKPLSALRFPFNQWIRAMPMEERFLAVKIHAPEIYQSIRSIFAKQQLQSGQRNGQQKSENALDGKKGPRKIQKVLLDSLVFVSDGHEFLDHICFQYSLLECPERLFDLLINTTENISTSTFEGLLTNRKNPKTLGLAFENIHNKQRICQELIEFLRQEIFSRFKEYKTIQESIQRNLEQQKKRKKQFSTHWKYLNEQMRYKLLLLGRKDIHFLHDYLQEQQIVIKINDLEKQIDDLVKLQKNDFCNRIFKCKFKKIFLPLVSYYEIIYKNWKKQVEKYKKKKILKNNRAERDFNSHNKTENKQYYKSSHNKKHKKNRKSNSLQSNQTNQTEHSTNNMYRQLLQDKENGDNYFDEFEKEFIQEQFRERQKNVHNFQKERDKSKEDKTYKYLQSEEELHEIKSEKVKIRHPIKGKEQKSEEEESKEESILHMQVPQIKKQVSIKDNPQSHSFTELDRLEIIQKTDGLQQQTKRKQQKKKAKQICTIKLEQQMQQLSDKISQQANEFHDRRIIAFQRIQFLLAFYNIPIKLFGSCANGIAIRNSDIDIAIDSFILSWMEFLPEGQRIKAALQKLEELFCTQSWVKELKVIKTAAIPVIKMTLNTQIPFLDPSIGEIYYELNRPHFSGQINADITIQTINESQQSCHLGIISTNAINKWIEEISSLHSIIIVMKYFFSKNNLNCTYEGGLNTFSMIVLFVAFIYHQKLEQQENPMVVLQRLLKFYVYEFDQKETGIDILNRQQNNIYFLKNLSFNSEISSKSKDKADLEIRDPMNQQKNMTRNCYSFFKIRSLFQLMLKNCFQKRQEQIDRILIQHNIYSQARPENDDILNIVRQHIQEKSIFCYVINQMDQFF